MFKMNKKKFLFFMMVAFSMSIKAQNEVAILQQNNTNHFFQGQNAFITAVDSATDGDIIYLSEGFFNVPDSIKHQLTIIGAGHFPPVAQYGKRTTLNSSLFIAAGADSLHIEGLYINGNIIFQENASINNVNITRCRVVSITFNSNTMATSKNNCVVRECYITNTINYCVYGYNLQIVQNIFSGDASNGAIINVSNCIITNNIFLLASSPYSYNVANISNSNLTGNIFYNGSNFNFNNTNNTYENNLLKDSLVNWGSNYNSDNYIGVTADSIFVNYVQGSVYQSDFHLKHPDIFVGGNNVQVGIYGGFGFKEQGRPFNPQVIRKSVGSEVLPDGTLPVNIKVQAQDK
jgi:hypothetical protein